MHFYAKERQDLRSYILNFTSGQLSLDHFPLAIWTLSCLSFVNLKGSKMNALSVHGLT